MLTFTPRAREAVLEFLEQRHDGERAVRITLHDGSPLAPRYGLALVDVEERTEAELELAAGEFTVFVERESAARLEGATVDFVEDARGVGFEIRDVAPPDAPAAPSGPLAERIQELLDTQINPGIASHGGAIRLVAVDGTDVLIEMTGGCQGCALSRMTLRQGVERMLRQWVPEITEVHDVTDHASGTNPYFSRSV
jgi:Fe/S biogenesis protein NfuA